jgi:hypothetical protein
MRAHTVTTMFRRKRSARRVAAIVLAACSLAIPASAGAYTSPNAITGGAEQSSQPAAGSGQSSLNAITQGSSAPSAPSAAGELTSAHQVDPGNPAYLSATAGEADVSSSSADDGFDWSSAVIGAGVAMAGLALGGAAFLTARRRTTVSPASSS